MWWLVYIIVSLALIKLYNTFTSGKCYSDVLLNGKVAIVTGSADGIGYVTALDLASRGARVILGCPHDTRGRDAVTEIIKSTNNDSVTCINLDLKSLTSVRRFVDEFKRLGLKLDILVNSADTRTGGDRKTEDGLIECMQINYLSQFLLTILLVPLLKKSAPSRVVIVSSNLHIYGNVKNINEPTFSLQAYCNSKLCGVLFSNELSRRLEGTGVVVNSLHPGYINTDESLTIIGKIQNLFLSIFFKNPAEGAQTSLHLAVSDDCDQVTGKYFTDCTESATSAAGDNRELAAELWTQTSDLVKLKLEENIQ